MKKKRRQYTREFKVEAVQLVTRRGYSIAEATVSLGVSANSIRTWKCEGNRYFFRGRRPLLRYLNNSS
jgi:transposase-like protein